MIQPNILDLPPTTSTNGNIGIQFTSDVLNLQAYCMAGGFLVLKRNPRHHLDTHHRVVSTNWIDACSWLI
ncbi:hypothetical protein [Nostoc sp. 106C]|uniref:hypothetical protein n=1 Tax=Nostoc sp. 106C TaxID=1932667 RepID=UPI001065D08F|nr:hypothetical protein [Nostoc sp. 106C]